MARRSALDGWLSRLRPSICSSPLICMLPVLATDVASSEWFAMPSATIARGAAIDHVVALDELAALLMEIIAARAME